MRDLNRRQFIDLALNTAKVGGLAVLLQNTPVYQIAKMLGVKPQHLPLVFRDWDLQAEAETLPLNYVSRTGLVPAGADMRDGIAGTASNAAEVDDGSSTMTDNADATLVKNGGSKNILFTLNGGTSAHYHYFRSTLTPLAMDSIPTIGVRFKATNINGGVNNAFDLYWSNNAGYTQYYRFTPNLASPLLDALDGWFFYQWHRDESSSNSGGPSWLSDFVGIQLLAATSAATAGSLIIDQLYYNGYQKPVIPWIFDGASDTHYSTVLAALTDRGLKATFAIPTSLVDSGAGFLTTANLDEIYGLGHDIIHESDTTTALTGLTVQQVTDRLGTADAFMESKGWTRTPNVIALPGTSTTTTRTDANVITALTTAGYRCAMARYADGTSGSTSNHGLGLDPNYGISLNPYRVPAWRAESADTITEQLAHIGHAIAAGQPRIFRTGGVGTGAGLIESADLTTALNYLALRHHANTLSFVPMSKFLSGLSGRMLR